MKTLEGLKADGYEYLKKITAVDYDTYLEIVYILYSMSAKREEIVKVKLPAESLSLPTVMHVFKAADWYERELAEMFGVAINGRSAG
ncbi:MAG: NADH-quinone oxidoreductase subunit C, partial [Candidatus Micrarchaeaceae archaeon]